METVLVIIDQFLQMKPVRWLLLGLVVAMIIITGFSVSRQKLLSLQLSAEKGQSATYAAHLKLQNEAILASNAEYQTQQDNMKNAKSKADQLKKDADDWRKVALRTPLTGSCDEMVTQVIGAIRQ